MVEDKFEETLKQNTVDNSKLEEILKKEITPQMQNEFFEALKESQLFLPVTFSDNMFEGIENAKEGDVFETTGKEGFDICCLSDTDGNKVVPLFTSDEAMKEAGVRTSVMVMFVSDIVDMLKQSDRYAAVAINPLTAHDINMPIGAFLGLFDELTADEKEFLESLKKVLDVLKEHSIELEENTTLFIRADENFMIDNAVDGVFTPNVPFYVSSNPKYGEEFKYTNILLMPKSKRILPIGSDNDLDIIIAPGSEFKLQDTMDETQNLWMCEKQPFYDE